MASFSRMIITSSVGGVMGAGCEIDQVGGPNPSRSLDLAQRFAAARSAQCVEEIKGLDVPVEIVSPGDNKQGLPPAHPTITRRDIQAQVVCTTGQALEVAAFDSRHGAPSVDRIRELSREGVFGGIGDVFTDSTVIARLWHQVTAYSPLALAPQYDREDLLPVPKLRKDRTVPRAGEPDREFDGFIPVPEADDARAAWRHHPDPIEVRRRGEHLKSKIVGYCLGEEMTDSEVRIAAVAGGAAWPDLRAVATVSRARPTLSITLDVFDWDKAAMSLGVVDARRILSTISDDVNVVTDEAAQSTTVTAGSNITVRFITADIADRDTLLRHAHEGGREGYNVVEAVGLVEYVPLSAASLVIESMDALAKPGNGRGVVANMTAYHDYVQIMGVIGWRALRPRDIGSINAFVNDGLVGEEPLREPKITLELLDSHSYLFVSWCK